MRLITCMLLATLVVTWDPVRPGALVGRAGDMIIVNQSVRILLNLENMTKIRNTLTTIKEGVKNVKNRSQDAEEPDARLWKRTTEIEVRLNKL